MRPIRTTPPIRKAVTVPLAPRDAFDLFTDGIDGWWPRRSRAGARLRLRPGRNGALREEAPDAPPRVWARVAVWEPGRRLVLTWEQGHREGEEPSEVEVLFTPVDAGTRVDLTHAAGPSEGFGWTAALASLARRAHRQATRSAGVPFAPSGGAASAGKVTASR
jgi:uncharacterized protein YndB with AHSA1/START domain